MLGIGMFDLFMGGVLLGQRLFYDCLGKGHKMILAGTAIVALIAGTLNLF